MKDHLFQFTAVEMAWLAAVHTPLCSVCASCLGGTDLFTNRNLVLMKGSRHRCPLADIEEYRLVGQTWRKEGGEKNNGAKIRRVDLSIINRKILDFCFCFFC